MKKLNVNLYQGNPEELVTKDNNNLFIDGEIEYNAGGGTLIKSISSIKNSDGQQIGGGGSGSSDFVNGVVLGTNGDMSVMDYNINVVDYDSKIFTCSGTISFMNNGEVTSFSFTDIINELDRIKEEWNKNNWPNQIDVLSIYGYGNDNVNVYDIPEDSQILNQLKDFCFFKPKYNSVPEERTSIVKESVSEEGYGSITLYSTLDVFCVVNGMPVLPVGVLNEGFGIVCICMKGTGDYQSIYSPIIILRETDIMVPYPDSEKLNLILYTNPSSGEMSLKIAKAEPGVV